MDGCVVSVTTDAKDYDFVSLLIFVVQIEEFLRVYSYMCTAKINPEREEKAESRPTPGS